MISDLHDRWRQRCWPQTLLVGTGAFLVLSGLFHTIVFLADRGSSWDGPVSWRKPILFGFSFGITLLAGAWIMTYLPRLRVRGAVIAVALAVSSVGEVFLIDMQRWRGVPSHFNFSTAFDSLVFAAGMAGFIAITILALVALTVWAFRSATGPPSVRLAIKVGLALLLVAQGLGGAVINGGNTQMSTSTGFDIHAARVFGPNGVLIGAAGVMKVPHGVSLHAVQVLLLLAWLCGFTAWREIDRVRIVAAGALGDVGILAVSAYQTFSGQAPLALVAGASTALWVSVVLLLGAFLAAAVGLVRPRRMGLAEPIPQ